MPRWSKLLLSALLIVVALAAIGLAVVWAKLPQVASAIATRVAGRPVEIGALSLWPGRWIGVDLRDASLANLQGGTRPKMATVSHVTGQIQLWPLLHGMVVARSVRIDDADLLLEKVDGQPNWRNGPKHQSQPGGGRADFPTLLGLVVTGTVTNRTTSGSPLVIKLEGVRLEADTKGSPTSLTGPGSYQGLPVKLDAKLGSFNQLHDTSTPFPTDITMTSGDTVLHFDGTMTDPLNVDGADGRLRLTAPQPGVLEHVAGIDPAPAPSLRIEGPFVHDGAVWRMRQAHGTLGNAALENGTLQLTEGSTQNKTPDRVQLDLQFGQIDADQLLAAFGSGGGSGRGSGERSGFVPAAAPDPELSATLQAAGLSYGSIKLTRPKLDVTLAPKLLKLENASFGGLGGELKMQGEVQGENGGKTGSLSATVSGTGLNVSDLGQALGNGQLPLRGRMDLHATAHGTTTTASALRRLDGAVVATMTDGSVSARLVELASTDVAGLFRSSQSMTPLSCVLAVVEIRNGVATLGPVRLRSGQGTIVAHGTVNLLRDKVDVVVASQGSTTGVLALDVPVHVSGSLGDPSVGLAGSGAGGAAGSMPDLPAALRTVAQGSACAH